MFKQASLKAFTSDFDVCEKEDSLVNKHCLVKCFEQPRMCTTWIGNCYRFASNCFPMIAASKYR